jgi:hypothetical protein
MNQRRVTATTIYLSMSGRGRLTKVRSVGSDDYIVAIEDVRDGRTHLLHTATGLGKWLGSFEQGRCIQPTAAICGRCDQLHVDRDVDGELLINCIGCCAELMVVGAEWMLG